MSYELNRQKSDRPRAERDFYPTPPELANIASQLFIDRIHVYQDSQLMVRCLDAGCGSGIWGIEFSKIFRSRYRESKRLVLVGVDIYDVDIEVESPYDSVYREDYLQFDGSCFDVVIGNPPFNLMEEFVRKSLQIVSDGGYVMFLGRLAFLESRKRASGLFRFLPPKYVHVLARRPSFFSANGKTKTTDTIAYAIYIWQRGYSGRTTLDWLDWNYTINEQN